MTAFGSLTAELRWVAWREEIRNGKPTKVPHCPHAPHEAKSDDPRTWNTRAAATARARNLVNGDAAGGIGIVLGDLGDGTALGGIDLDTCRRDDGTFEAWASEIIERFASYTETSPSGNGAKIFFRYRTVDLPTIRDAMGGPQHGREFKRGNGKDHPPAIELYLSNRYFTVTEQKLEEAPDSIVIVPTDLLSWVLCEAGPIFAGGSTTESANSNGRDSSRSA